MCRILGYQPAGLHPRVDRGGVDTRRRDAARQVSARLPAGAPGRQEHGRRRHGPLRRPKVPDWPRHRPLRFHSQEASREKLSTEILLLVVLERPIF